MRDTTAAAKSLMEADNDWLREVALRDPDMIRDVAAALIHARSPLPERRHHADCELRGMPVCYCDQDQPDEYYQ